MLSQRWQRHAVLNRSRREDGFYSSIMEAAAPLHEHSHSKRHSWQFVWWNCQPEQDHMPIGH